MTKISLPSVKRWNIEAVTGYKPISTFYEDFGMAEIFGLKAVRNLYEQAISEWKDNTAMLTELIMALNWKQFEHVDKDGVARSPMCLLYCELYLKGDEFARNYLKDDALMYYYQTTD